MNEIREVKDIEDALYSLGYSQRRLNIAIFGCYFDQVWVDFMNLDKRYDSTRYKLHLAVMERLKAFVDACTCSDRIRKAESLEVSEWETFQGGLSTIADGGTIDKTHKTIIKIATAPRESYQEKADQFRPLFGDDFPLGFWLNPAGEVDFDRLTDPDRVVATGRLGGLYIEGVGDRTFSDMRQDLIYDGFLWLKLICACFYWQAEPARHRLRRCEAPDCNKFFIPKPRSHGQIYHTRTCRSRHNMQKRRNGGL